MTCFGTARARVRNLALAAFLAIAFSGATALSNPVYAFASDDAAAYAAVVDEGAGAEEAEWLYEGAWGEGEWLDDEQCDDEWFSIDWEGDGEDEYGDGEDPYDEGDDAWEDDDDWCDDDWDDDWYEEDWDDDWYEEDRDDDWDDDWDDEDWDYDDWDDEDWNDDDWDDEDWCEIDDAYEGEWAICTDIIGCVPGFRTGGICIALASSASACEPEGPASDISIATPSYQGAASIESGLPAEPIAASTDDGGSAGHGEASSQGDSAALAHAWGTDDAATLGSGARYDTLSLAASRRAWPTIL